MRVEYRQTARNNAHRSAFSLRGRRCYAAKPLAPSLISDAYDAAQYAFLRLAIDNPVKLRQSTVHVLGICHHDPINPFLISSAWQEIGVKDKQGLVIALESSDTRLSVLNKALQSSPSLHQAIKDLVDHPPPSLSLEPTLSNVQLEQWHSALNSALSSSFCLPIQASDIPYHFLMGHPQYSEEIAACHFASQSSVPVVAIDLPVGHSLNEQASAFEFCGKVYEAITLTALDSEASSETEKSLGQSFRSWADEAAGLSQPHFTPPTSFCLESFIIGVLAVSCLNPAMMKSYNELDQEANPLAFDVVVTQRNDYMAQQIGDLASTPAGWRRRIKYGLSYPDVARTPPPSRILAIVGRSHVNGLIQALTKQYK